ncbi:MAG: CbrC family protein [Mycobacteriales bacterium]
MPLFSRSTELERLYRRFTGSRGRPVRWGGQELHLQYHRPLAGPTRVTVRYLGGTPDPTAGWSRGLVVAGLNARVLADGVDLRLHGGVAVWRRDGDAGPAAVDLLPLGTGDAEVTVENVRGSAETYRNLMGAFTVTEEDEDRITIRSCQADEGDLDLDELVTELTFGPLDPDTLAARRAELSAELGADTAERDEAERAGAEAAAADPPLPEFAYHPDPVATGAVEVAAITCAVCGRRRGHAYTGPIFSEEEHEQVDPLCPWCIADGRAHETWDCVFSDDRSFMVGDNVPVPPEVGEDVFTRTPGFRTHQSVIWLSHHDDACQYLGPVGADRYATLDAGARAAVEAAAGDPAALRTGYPGPTAYLFRCRDCGEYRAYTDSA